MKIVNCVYDIKYFIVINMYGCYFILNEMNGN